MKLFHEQDQSTAHLNFMSTNIAKNNPMIMGSLEKNIFEHMFLQQKTNGAP